MTGHLEPMKLEKKKGEVIPYFVYKPASSYRKSLKEVVKLLSKPTIISKPASKEVTIQSL